MRVREYLREVYDEMTHKVTWPTWRELQNSAIIVMIASLCIAAVVLVMDLAFEHVLDWIYRVLY